MHTFCQRLPLPIVLLTLAVGPTASAQTPTMKGPQNCYGCHNDGPDSLSPRDLCLLDEGLVWRDRDLHRKAYDALTSELGQRIGRTLGLTATDDQRCLSCHAGQQPIPAPGFDDIKTFGVSCESCHGPGSEYEKPHSDVRWRTKTPAEKAELGMIDVRNPTRRIQQCASCHVGDFEQGKVLTHEMYAAGHPPLPAFDFVAFSRAMPAHWRNVREKDIVTSRQEFLQLNYGLDAQKAEAFLPDTQAAVISGLVAYRSTVELSAKLLSPGEKSPWREATLGPGPELAAFDCSACHHELVSPSWRQQRHDGKHAPGRPVLPDWPAGTLPLISAYANAEPKTVELYVEVQSQRGALQKAVAARPFGDPSQVSEATDRLVEDLDRLIEQVRGLPADADAVGRLKEAIVKTAASEPVDFHTARQRAWILAAIAHEFGTGYAGPRSPEAWPARQEAKAAKFDELMRNPIFKTFDRLLELDTRRPAGASSASAQWLEAQSQYDAREVQEAFRRLLPAADAPR